MACCGLCVLCDKSLEPYQCSVCKKVCCDDCSECYGNNEDGFSYICNKCLDNDVYTPEIEDDQPI